MGTDNMQHPTTPINRPKNPQCSICPCQTDFQSDSFITSAIESEERTALLIDWLSGKNLDASDGNVCTNRLHASILILNSIREACRDHLESAVTNDEPTKAESADKRQQQQTIWEDSFPALSSAASTVTPTILFGRKKESDGGAPVAAAAARNNDGATLQKNGSVNDRAPVPISNRMQKSNQQVVNVPKVKKKIKPVTISSIPANNSSVWGSTSSATTSVWSKPAIKSASNDVVQGNIASLPSQPVQSQSKTFLAKPMHAKNGNLVNSTSNEADSLTTSPCTPLKQPTNLPKCTSSDSKNSAEPQPEVNAKESESQLIRLVNVYATILKYQLAPYLLLELHLLVRLVSISDNNEATVGNINPNIPFNAVFSSSRACRDFGAKTILAIEPIILNLGHDALKMLASLDSLRRHCPCLTTKMNQIIETNNSTLSFESGERALGANANTPHLTLPFDHARDSRHNYRSADRNRLFKEREELRDVFLFQLRAFQDVRGRLMEEEVSSKIIENIAAESRKMMQCLAVENIGWFVDFFCELLLQIGLVPIGETDSDVLKQVADQKRLQKLHKRFTTRGNQTNKHSSSRKLTVDQKQTSSSPDSLSPKQCFRGHQEFFALFINACDSYKFNTHLQRRLSQLITDLTSTNDTKFLCQKIIKTTMLAKFLGLLVFSPNWSVSRSETPMYTTGIAVPPIDLIDQLNKAWMEYRLVLVIPWVVEFLKMMKWDISSKKSHYYTNAFALLWSINNHCYSSCLDGQSVLSTSSLVISLQLASLFNDLIGFTDAWSLTIATLPQRHAGIDSNDTSLRPMDALPLWFRKTFLFSTTTHFQDLFELVNYMQSTIVGTSKAGLSGTKKVRPQSISTGPLKDYVELDVWKKLSPMRSSLSSPKSLSADSGGKVSTRDKLVDCFFHQHQELQNLCETTIDWAIKNFARSTLQGCIMPIFKEKATSYEEFLSRSPSMELNEYIELLQSLDVTANLKAREEMNNQLSRIIRGSLELLSPPDTQPKVREIASSLALQHAFDKGDQFIRSFIREEKKKFIDEFIRKESKFKAGVPLKAAIGRHINKAPKSVMPEVDLKSLVDLTDLLSKFDTTEAVGPQLFDQLNETKESVADHLQKYFLGTDSPSCFRAFQTKMIALFNKYLSASQLMPSLLFALFQATEVLCLLCEVGYLDADAAKELELMIQDSVKLKKILSVTTINCEADIKLAGMFLFHMIYGSLVKYSIMEDSLVTLLADGDVQHLKKVIEVLLNNLAASLGFDSWRDDGFVIMIRLQRMMAIVKEHG